MLILYNKRMLSSFSSSENSSSSSSSSSVISSVSTSSNCSDLTTVLPSSIIGEYFSIIVNFDQSKIGTCRICNKQIIINDKSGGNFINHLRHNHQTHYQEYSSKQSLRRSAIANKKRKESASQTLITFPSLGKDSTQKFQESLALFMAATGLPHLLLHNDLFKQVLINFALCTKPSNNNHNNMNDIMPPHHSMIRKQILALGNDVFEKIITSISNKSQLFTTLAVDGWTGQKFGGKNTNIIGIAQKQPYLLWSDRNEDTEDSATDYITPLLTEKITYLIKRDVAVVAFVTDNAPNMRKSGAELYQNELFGRVVLRVSCSAHTIQLMIEEIFALEPLAAFFNNCLKLLESFKSKDSKKLRLELSAMQRRVSQKAPKKIMFYNSTRWWSKTKSLQRLLELRAFLILMPSNEQIPFKLRRQLGLFEKSEFWNTLEEFMHLVECFQRATDLVQGNGASFLSLTNALSGMMKFMRNWDIKTKLNVDERTAEIFRMRCVEIIQRKTDAFLASTEHHAVHAVQLLSRDKSISEWPINAFNETFEWIAGWGADLLLLYPKHFPVVTKAARSEIMNKIKQQFACFQGKIEGFHNSDTLEASLRQRISINSFEYDEKKPIEEQTEVNWEQYWSMYLTAAPELASVARCLFSIGISEAMCERSFSIQQLTHSKIRNRLNDDIVEAEMRIRFNKNLLQFEVEKLLNPEASDDSDDEEKDEKEGNKKQRKHSKLSTQDIMSDDD
jgi:hypothetical protein